MNKDNTFAYIIKRFLLKKELIVIIYHTFVILDNVLS